MMVNAPDHTLAAASFLPADAGSPRMGVVESVLRKIQSVMCGLHGHDSVLQYERTRIFLRCTSCGHETPGWDVPPIQLAFHSRTEARAVRPDLGLVRKVA
jgi:hypothetical protein